ncbi:hypothetical protein Peur_008356 [Populus x canadensis]
MHVFSLIGSLATGRTSDYIGRRYTIVLAAATFLIGALIMGFAPSFLFLMAGRVVAGIGFGFSLLIAPVYTSELSPAMARAFPAIVVALGVMVMPESPHSLVMKGRYDEAKQVLIKTSESTDEAELRLAEMIKAATDLTNVASSSNWRGQGAWKELLFSPSRPIRRILIATIGVNFFMQASGNDAVVYYSPKVFKDAGIQSRKQLIGVTIIMGIAKTSYVWKAAPLVAGLSKYLEQSNSKPLWSIALCVAAVCAAVSSFFSTGLRPITWVYSSEIFPTRLRAQGSSLAISVNRLGGGITAMTFIKQERPWKRLGFSLKIKSMEMTKLLIHSIPDYSLAYG